MSLLSSPPKHQNPELENIVKENQGKSKLYLTGKKLSDDDMEIVAYYLAQNHKVSNVVFSNSSEQAQASCLLRCIQIAIKRWQNVEFCSLYF